MESIQGRPLTEVRTEESSSSASPVSVVSTHHTPLFTAHLSSKVANGRVFRPYLINEIYEDLVPLMEAFRKSQKTEEEIKPILHEFYSKVLAYDCLPKEINLPVFEDGNLHFYPFTVKELVLTKGNKALLLLPMKANKKVSPILLFCGTSPKYRSGTLVANFGPKAIKKTIFSTKVLPSFDVGRVIVENDGEWIAGMIKHHVEEGHGKFIISGHSLGGATAAKIAMDGENHEYIEDLVTFNAPGVTKREIEKYDNLETKFKATNYTTGSDWIGNLFACKRFIGKKYLITPNDIDIKKDRHGACILSSNNFTKSEIMPDKKRCRTYKAIQTTLACTIGLVPRFLLILSALIVLAIHNSGAFDYFKKERKATRAHAQICRKSLQALPEWEIQECASEFYTQKRELKKV